MTMLWKTAIVISFLAMAWPCLGQSVPEKPPASPPKKLTLAQEIMRREAQAAAKAKESAFEAIKELPPPPVEERLLVVDNNRLKNVVVSFKTGQLDENGEPLIVPAIAEDVFDLYVFGSTGDLGSGLAHVEMLLNRKIDDLERRRGRLSDVEKKKLLLAGRGDIKRLFDRIENERKTFNDLRTDLDRCEDFLRSLLPVRRNLIRGPFGAGSILEKAYGKLVTDEIPDKG